MGVQPTIGFSPYFRSTLFTRPIVISLVLHVELSTISTGMPSALPRFDISTRHFMQLGVKLSKDSSPCSTPSTSRNMSFTLAPRNALEEEGEAGVLDAVGLLLEAELLKMPFFRSPDDDRGDTELICLCRGASVDGCCCCCHFSSPSSSSSSPPRPLSAIWGGVFSTADDGEAVWEGLEEKKGVFFKVRRCDALYKYHHHHYAELKIAHMHSRTWGCGVGLSPSISSYVFCETSPRPRQQGHLTSFCS
jgi:hypothetical protein